MRSMWKRVALAVVPLLILVLAGCGGGPAAGPGAAVGSPSAGPTPPAGEGGNGTGSARVPAGSVRFFQAADGASAWIWTDRQVFRTADGGRRWEEVTPAGFRGTWLAAALVDAASGSVAAVAQDGAGALTVWRTADGGKRWQDAPVGSPDDRRGAVAGTRLVFAGAGHGWLLVSHGVAAGSEWVDVYTSGDGGASWRPAATTDPEDQGPGRLPLGGLKTGIGARDEATAWVTGLDYGEELWLYRTRDGGRTWERQAVAAPDGFETGGGAAETRPPVFFEDGGFLPVLFHQERQPAIFYATRDRGETWQATTPVQASGAVLAWSFLDPKHGFATDGTKVYATKDGGRSWEALVPDRDLAGVSQLAFASPEAGWALVDGSLLRTEDGGHAWTAVVP